MSINTKHEINEAVARKLGIPRIEVTPESEESFEVKLPDYCGSIAAAWEVVERLHPLHGITLVQHLQPTYGWSCEMWTARTEEPDFTVRVDTAPMAICMAFLKLEDGK